MKISRIARVRTNIKPMSFEITDTNIAQ